LELRLYLSLIIFYFVSNIFAKKYILYIINRNIYVK